MNDIELLEALQRMTCEQRKELLHRLVQMNDDELAELIGRIYIFVQE
jgi:hypothetical protein